MEKGRKGLGRWGCWSVLERAGPRATAACSAVCRSWRDVAGSDQVWRRHCRRGMGGGGAWDAVRPWREAFRAPDATDMVLGLLEAQPLSGSDENDGDDDVQLGLRSLPRQNLKKEKRLTNGISLILPLRHQSDPPFRTPWVS